MKVKTFTRAFDFISVAPIRYIDDIRGDNPKAFTRHRTVSPFHVMLQMFGKKGLTQHAELRDFNRMMDSPLDVSTVGYFKARNKFNAEAVRLMANDFTAEVYAEETESLKTWHGYIVTAIDGSDFVAPSTAENEKIYGTSRNQEKDENNPVMGKLSIMYDSINRLVIDTQVERYKYSEVKLAMRHLEVAGQNIHQNMLMLYDRGYFSYRLAYQMNGDGHKYLFRLRENIMKEEFSQIDPDTSREFTVRMSQESMNYYYKVDREFYAAMMEDNTYHFRLAKIRIGDSNGEPVYEHLLTNVSADEVPDAELKNLYHLRWDCETCYNVLKNKMKIEQFSGFKDNIIRQDIYATVWLYNIIMLRIIEADEETPIKQGKYKHKMKRNVNKTIGIIKENFVRMIVTSSSEEKKRLMDQVKSDIESNIVPIREGRSSPRKKRGNKHRRSYTNTY